MLTQEVNFANPEDYASATTYIYIERVEKKNNNVLNKKCLTQHVNFLSQQGYAYANA